MKIRIDFTIEFDTADLPAVREFMCVETNDALRVMLVDEAAHYLMGYLEDNATTPRRIDREFGGSVQVQGGPAGLVPA